MSLGPIGGGGGDNNIESFQSLHKLRTALQAETEIHKQIDLLSHNMSMLVAFLILPTQKQQDIMRGIDQQITAAEANMGEESEEGRKQKKRYEHFSLLKERLKKIQAK